MATVITVTESRVKAEAIGKWEKYVGYCDREGMRMEDGGMERMEGSRMEMEDGGVKRLWL
jgi:hypothetical protein